MGPVLRYEFAYPATLMFKADERFQFGREPTPRRMPDGSLVSFVYTGGPHEPHTDNVAAIIRSTDDGESWSKPEILFQHPSCPTLGTEIFTETGRPFAVFLAFSAERGAMDQHAYRAYTDDSGKSWGPPASIPGVPSTLNVRQGKVLSDGSWIFPVYWIEQRDGDWRERWTVSSLWIIGSFHYISGVIRSTDGGKTFSLHGAISTPSHAMEPEVTELEPGHLKMFIRCEHGVPVLWESESFDYGQSWSKAQPSSIPNPSAKCVIYKIRNCHVLVNNVCTKRADRTCLELWVSSDNCASWSKKLPLAKVRVDASTKWDDSCLYPQVSYPHGFADDAAEKLYLAIDSMWDFHFLKIPYADLL